MKSKLVTALLAAVLLALVFAHGQTDRTSTIPGRYQIVSGEYELAQKNNFVALVPLKCVFRIDTQTGQTWLWVAFTDEGKLTQKWVPTE